MRKTKLTIFLAVSSLALFGVAGIVSAAPIVTGVTGDLNNGATVTVAGSGFGVKTIAVPWVWDNFEDGTLGNLIGTSPKGIWQQYWSTGAVFPSYQSGAYAGSLCAKKTTALAEEFYSYSTSGLMSDEMYYSIMFKYTKDTINDPAANPVMKLTRMHTQGDVYHANPRFNHTLRSGSGWTYIDILNGITDIANPPERFQEYITQSVWHRIEVYMRLSTPGVADGEVQLFLDGEEYFPGEYVNIVTRESGYGDQKMNSIILPMMHSLGFTSPNQNIFSYYVDDVYVDRTRARVEIGNASTWVANTHREIQIPSAWSDSSVTITLNQGSFDALEGKYLYVIDADGNVNANGYLLTTADTTPPSAPQGLVVN